MKWLNKLKKLFTKKDEFDYDDDSDDENDGYFKYTFEGSKKSAEYEINNWVPSYSEYPSWQYRIDYFKKYPEEHQYLHQIESERWMNLRNTNFQVFHEFNALKKGMKVFFVPFLRRLPEHSDNYLIYNKGKRHNYFAPAVFAPFLRKGDSYPDEPLPIKGVDYTEEDYEFYVGNIEKIRNTANDDDYLTALDEFIEICRADGRMLTVEEEQEMHRNIELERENRAKEETSRNS